MVAARSFSITLLTLLLCAQLSAGQNRTPAQQFLITSDIHFNPMADASLVADLAAHDPARWEAILNRSNSTAYSQYGQDTNWWLLQSALDAMKKSVRNPAFIVITGDTLAHHFRDVFRQSYQNGTPELYRKFVSNTFAFVSLQLRKRFPSTPILITPGNNDDDCGDYGIEAGGPFLQDTAALSRQLARGDPDFIQSWTRLGSFDIPHPALRGVRMISVNSVFFSAKYQSVKFSEGCRKTPSSAPVEMLAWLQERLAQAQKAHEKVWLMFHIPPGMDGYSSIAKYESLLKTGEAPAEICPKALVPLWTPQWTARFEQLLDKYADTVTVSLAGHTHADDFRVINAGSPQMGFALIDPPISPVYNQNPAFRIATFTRDGSLQDQSVYYLANLLYASKTTPGSWQREYTFSQTWKVRGINAANLAAINEKVKHNDEARADWLKLFNVSSAAAHVPAGAVPGLYCAVEGLNAETFGNCFCPAMTGGGKAGTTPAQK